MPIQVQDGKNTKNMSKPREVAPALSVKFASVHVPKASAFKGKRIKNRRSSVDENGRRMPWEVSNGDELFDEFGSYSHDERHWSLSRYSTHKFLLDIFKYKIIVEAEKDVEIYCEIKVSEKDWPRPSSFQPIYKKKNYKYKKKRTSCHQDGGRFQVPSRFIYI